MLKRALPYVLVLFVVSPAARSADPEWQLVNGQAADSLFEVACGGGKYVAVGETGEIIRSGNALDWEIVREADEKTTLQGVAYGDGHFKIGGADGLIMHSTDGATWAVEPCDTEDFISGMAYGNGIWVAVGGALRGGEGLILTSSEQGVWARQDPGAAKWLSKVAFGNGVFVAVGQEGMVMRSADGITWTEQDSGFGRYLSGIEYADGKFVAVGQRSRVLVSEDGIEWRSGVIPHPVGIWLFTATYGSGEWVVAGETGICYASEDLEVWRQIDLGISEDLFGSCNRDGNMLIVGAPSKGTGVVARREIPGEAPPPPPPPLTIRRVPGEGESPERAAVGFTLAPAGAAAWAAIRIWYSDDLTTWEPLGIEPSLVASDAAGDSYEAVDPTDVQLQGSRSYRAEFVR